MNPTVQLIKAKAYRYKMYIEFFDIIAANLEQAQRSNATEKEFIIRYSPLK